jgi:GNAT superfamily N-acetyltransferase
MYIADLCSDSEGRSKGYGQQLWEYLEQVAKAEGCARILLDSGTQRTRAHKFYLNRGMVIRSFNFSKHL